MRNDRVTLVEKGSPHSLCIMESGKVRPSYLIISQISLECQRYICNGIWKKFMQFCVYVVIYQMFQFFFQFCMHVPSKWLSIFSTFQLLPGVKVVIANPDTKGQCADSHLGEVSPRLAAVQHFLWTIQTIPVDGVMRSFYVISCLFIDRFGSTVHTMLQGTLWSMGTTRFMLNILTRI